MPTPIVAESKPQPVEIKPVAGAEEIKTYVLAVVSEKTGYPVEVLDLDLDLEADLGIDTVKQAELFAAIREKYGIARREDLRLSDYNTLAKVIAFVKDSIGTSPVAVQSQPEAAPVVAATPVPTPSAQPNAESDQGLCTLGCQ